MFLPLKKLVKIEHLQAAIMLSTLMQNYLSIW